MRNLPFDQKIAVANLERLRSLMNQREVDLLIGSDPATVRYVTGRGVFPTRGHFEAAFGETVIVTRSVGLPVVFVPSHHIEFWRERVGIVEVRSNTEFTKFLEIPACKQSKKVEFSSDTHRQLIELASSVLTDSSFDLNGPVISDSRLLKSELELEAMKRAGKVASQGMEVAIKSCKRGVRECEVAGNAERAMRIAGAEGFAFPAVVSSGPNAGLFSEMSTKKKIRNGETVVIDLGATVDGYNSEFSRTVVVGKTSKQLAKAYSIVYNALQQAILQVRDGTKARDIDHVARRVIMLANLPVHSHYTGHGLGTAAWERPVIGPESSEIIKTNMVIALEPGSYFPKVGGVKLEENLIVTTKNSTLISAAPFEDRFL